VDEMTPSKHKPNDAAQVVSDLLIVRQKLSDLQEQAQRCGLFCMDRSQDYASCKWSGICIIRRLLRSVK